MKFSELIKTPDITLEEPGQSFKIISFLKNIGMVFHVDHEDEQQIAVQKSNPIGENDNVYASLKKHFKLEPHFFIVENVPYNDIDPAYVEIGSKVGIILISKEIRMGGYGTILKRVEKSISNQGTILVKKNSLCISMPVPLKTINRRKRFRVSPQVEDYFCEISGFAVNRNSPIPVFPVRNCSDIGLSILMTRIPEEHIPENGDSLYVRFTLFASAKGYERKRGVVVSEDEVKSGNVTQQQFVFKCKVIHTRKATDIATEVGVEFIASAREGITSATKDFPRLTYIPLEESKNTEPIVAWCNQIILKQRAQEKKKEL